MTLAKRGRARARRARRREVLRRGSRRSVPGHLRRRRHLRVRQPGARPADADRALGRGLQPGQDRGAQHARPRASSTTSCPTSSPTWPTGRRWSTSGPGSGDAVIRGSLDDGEFTAFYLDDGAGHGGAVGRPLGRPGATRGGSSRRRRRSTEPRWPTRARTCPLCDRARAAVPRIAPRRHAAADAEPVGPRVRRDAGVAGLRGAGHHEQRLRGDAWPARRPGHARRGDRPRRRGGRRGVSVPVSADLENCFADEPEGVAETVRLAAEAGLAGCSVEDYSGPDGDTIYDAGLAAERVAAAAEAAHAGAGRLRAHGAGREPRARPRRPRRHDRASPELPGGRRRRAVRARVCASCPTSAS